MLVELACSCNSDSRLACAHVHVHAKNGLQEQANIPPVVLHVFCMLARALASGGERPSAGVVSQGAAASRRHGLQRSGSQLAGGTRRQRPHARRRPSAGCDPG